MTDRFDTYRPDGEPTADRWVGALRLFEEETTADRWERAGLLFEDRKYIEAAKLLAGVVDEFPGHTAARLLLARAYYHSAQLRRAEEQLRAVIEADPVEHYAHLMLGRTLERQDRGAEAAPWLRMADAFSGGFDETGGFSSPRPGTGRAGT